MAEAGMMAVDRPRLEALAVEKLQWNPREALMATSSALMNALTKKGNVSWSTIMHKPPPKTVNLECEQEAEDRCLPTASTHRKEQEETKDEKYHSTEKKPQPQQAATQPPNKQSSQLPPHQHQQQMPSMAEALQNFDSLFEDVRSELQIEAPRLDSHDTPVDPPLLELPPPCTTQEIAIEITSLRQKISALDVKLQRRRVCYLIMSFDQSGVFAKDHIESYKKMIDKNEADLLDMRAALKAAATKMHDASRVRQATGDRMLALGLIDKATLSMWEKFNVDLQMQTQQLNIE